MYGPIANLPGYNPNATYLPPGIAAPSSYPERTAPRQQFYDMAPLPSVVDQSIMDLASSGLSSSDPSDSAFGWSGISGGIGGPDALEYQFLNFLAQQAKPKAQPQQQMVAPNFTGPSNDQYSGVQTVPPVFAGPQQPPSRVGTVSFKEGADIGDEMVPPVFAGPSADYGYGGLGDLQQYYQQPQQSRTGTVSAQEGDQLYAGSPITYDFPQSMQGFGLPSLQSLADANGVIDTYSTTSRPGMFSSRWFDSLTNSPNSFTLGNAAQLGINALLPAGLSQLVSAGAGALGIGTNDTGNPVLNYLSQPSFGVGTNNMPSLPANSQVMTDRGATGIDWANMSPAERSLQDAYSRTDVYDPNGSGWQLGTTAPSTQPNWQVMDQNGSVLAANPDMGYASPGYSNWYDGQPDPYSITGNMNAPNGFMAGAGFGAGRYENASNPYAGMGNGWDAPGGYVGTAYWDEMFGPGARFGGSDPNNTD